MRHRQWSRRGITMLFLGSLAVAVVGCTPVVEGTTDGFPDRPVELVVPFSAGGPTDIVGRVVADGLAQELGAGGQRAQIPVVNKPGAGGIVGTVEVMNANPDGYSLTVVTGTSYGSQPHFESTPYGPTDLTPIAELTALPSVLVVSADSEIESFADYVAEANSRTDGLRYGTTGVGSSAHVSFAALSGEAEMQTSDVPYEGNAPMINALLGNNLDSAVIQSVDAVPNVESGDFRPLVVLGSHRPEGFEDVPLATELGYTIDNDLFFGIAGPPDMNPELVALLEKKIKAALATDATEKRFANLKMKPAFKGREAFQSDIDGMGTVVDKANEFNGGPLK